MGGAAIEGGPQGAGQGCWESPGPTLPLSLWGNTALLHLGLSVESSTFPKQLSAKMGSGGLKKDPVLISRQVR